MNRQSFLSLISLAAIPASLSPMRQSVTTEKTVKEPPPLKPGDIIGITCPSGFITASECQAAIDKMQKWGLRVKIGNTIGAKDFTMAGTDAERIADLQNMLDDPGIKAVMFGRGGYGAVRIIDQLDFKTFSKHPKWLIGFSDATVFHLHIHRHFGIATVHSKMCNSFPDNFSEADDILKETIESIRKCITGEKMIYQAPPNPGNRMGSARGPVIGGNLSLLTLLCGSDSDVNTKGKILFIEDVGEYLYRIDGMLWNLKRSGKLKGLKGLIVGRFRIKPDTPGEEFGKSLADLVMEKVKDYDYPVCFDFPVGHVRENYALKCGAVHELTVTKGGARMIDDF